MVLSEFIFIYFFLFFRRQGFRMIIFDRQVGPLQNFNRSHVMVIGRSVLFSDPARGAPQTAQNSAPPKKIFASPQIFFSLRFKTTGRCFCEKKKAVTINFQPPPPHHRPTPTPPRPRPALRTLTSILVQ